MTDQRDGFEYQGEFYGWSVTDIGKDLMLIDRFSGLPIHEFFQLVDDDHERGRGPILLTLIATSIRAGHPDWTAERVIRTVMDLSLSEVTFLNADKPESQEGLPDSPPAETAESNGSTGDASPSPSKSTSSDPPPERSGTFSATPA
jgi:hypothetical protein